MALETGRMAVEPRRDRQRRAAGCGLVTCRAVGQFQVPPVIEVSSKAFQRRKRFYVGRGVTDIADRLLIVRPLLLVARRAGNMAGITHRGPVIVSHVANQTWHSRVLRRVVPEPGKFLCRGRIHRFGCRYFITRNVLSPGKIAQAVSRHGKRQHAEQNGLLPHAAVTGFEL